ncbi:MAG: FIST N-terminal domain-containing protein [Planctomycetota bacterium]
MQLETFEWSAKTGWSVGSFPSLDGERTLVVVFGSSAHIDRPAPITELARFYARSHLIGCSTSGEIFQSRISDGSLAVAVAQFAASELRTASTAVGKEVGSFAAGAALARQLAAPTLRSVLVLSDGLSVNGSELVQGLNSVLPEHVVVTGGLAGDGDRFQRTWVIEQGVPKTGYVTAVGLCGDRLDIGHGSKGGWDIFGPERVVTRARGNVLFELDGSPALQLYKQYLGERASGLPATGLLFPLAIREHASDERHLVRTILSVDEQAQSMTFAGDVPQGWRAQLMKANFDRLIGGASEAAQLSKRGATRSAARLAIAVSCVGRRLVLGERAEEEVEATLDVLDRGARQIGFYSYGEISPYTTGSCDLHNQTMTLTTISER